MNIVCFELPQYNVRFIAFSCLPNIFWSKKKKKKEQKLKDPIL
jgi:hypothetical protein